MMIHQKLKNNHHFSPIPFLLFLPPKRSDTFSTLLMDSYLSFRENRRTLKSYLFTLSRNYALNYLRHKKVMAANEEAVMRDTQELQDQLDEYEQAMNRLKEKVEKLPAKQREVLDKYFIEGKTYKEIADELDISLNTVKTHLRRALKFLRDELQEEMILLLLLKKQPIEPQK
ncbi:MAG: sigma-70 family RNA polymerase sigma factor [Odoribacter sp.]